MNAAEKSLVVFQAQHQGTREYQEDALGVTSLDDVELINQKGYLAAIADGMGGLSHGSRASHAAIDRFLKEHRERPQEEPAAAFLQRTLRIANVSVFDKAFIDGQEVELGTTLVAILIETDKLHWISVGDSHIFHFREGRLQQLNTEHVYANQLKMQVKNGEMTAAEAQVHPERDHLTSYLGLPEIPEINHGQEPLQLKLGDRVILCSDGLSGVLTREEMEALLSGHHHDPATEMIRQVLAKQKRHQDNVTVIIVECTA
ncbi:PP2C family protein-serine/threonine phosphatase [Anoxynatronum buryatiense]|uniref:Protein phosphatase n=1 Tax=Anoxynatronum buryatiense TaxID=489973 RepID=A0AA46AJX3_9CLOT|nr:protein phosphatase 2C domain-containing protein [Anoxynatronum buryatiense]SMP65261.1 protein phosphatase [Anoxynatronum buryatiense]